eukprot:GFUD01037533.1.p1 GENE.GFUD01037533.1~~GFUD01037533.1.p1  ORF type:complete len:516 (+),score=112.45 GFUD01037533.1:99-1550(+)
MELIILLSLVTFLLIYFLKRRGNTSPPGPKRIPFLGSLPFLPTKKGITDWVLEDAVTRHKIARVDFGPNPAYFINDFELAKTLFDKAEFSGRKATPTQLLHRYFNKTPQGILFTQNEQWSTNRRFSLKTLKDFGFGKKSIEDSIHFEVEELSETFLSAKGDNLIGTDFNVPIINILWQMVADSRFTPQDPEGMKMVENVTNIFITGIKFNHIPLFINQMFSTWTGYLEKIHAHENIRDYLMKIVEKHEVDLDLENPKDFIDVYLIEMKKQSGGQEYNKEELAGCLYDFFVAGTETSSTTLKWIVLYLSLHQEVQDRCRNEIISVLGGTKASVSDMPSLPYTQATISEIQRVSRVAPTSVPHKTTQITTVREFTFPKQSTFFANISFIMNDPKYFQDPHTFDPSRFINSDGRFIKNERVIPFGIGKRYCMGELLARNEIFLFMVTMLQKIQFKLPQDHPKPDPQNYICNLTRIPDDFYVQMEKA